MVVAAEDGLDELSLSSRDAGDRGRRAARPRSGSSSRASSGLRRAELEDVAGGTPEENAAATRAVFDGEQGPQRDLVLLNAGAAIYVGGAAESLEAGVAKAAEAIDSRRGKSPA